MPFGQDADDAAVASPPSEAPRAAHKHHETRSRNEEAQAATRAARRLSGRPAGDGRRSVARLTELKGLLNSGVLTQAEFDAEKQKILGA